ncbi:MAG: ABC transporter permease [Bacteroidales bacterium]|nr:ABC transporter permease [Bacteroidales bacterium]
MTIFNFILKSFWFFRRQHLAVFAGALISTAVLTGALIVGDSVKFSLKQIVDARLGNIKFAMQTGDRFVRSELADDISKDLNIATSPILMLQGISINTESRSRINKTQINGIDQSFWKLSNKTIPELSEDEVIISNNVAQKLNLKIDDEILLRVENANVIPLNAPFAKETDPSVSFRVIVKAIADDENLGRFGLKNIQSAPYNIFVSMEYLARKIDLQGLANIIITSDNIEQNLKVEDINYSLSRVWQPEDANIVIRELDNIGKIEMLSNRIFIDLPISESLKNFEIPNETILTYLVNTIRFNEKETPYSFVTATSSPFLPKDMKENEIIINEWLASDLNVSISDTIEIDYFIIGPLRTLEEKSNKFIVKNIIPTRGNIANKSLMPLFPGLSDAGSCSDWETGIPIDLERIRDKDEKYWDDYKGTPKALISIQTGLNLWKNKYGSYTAIRFDKNDISPDNFKNEILKKLNPNDLNLSFTPVHSEGIQAASGGVDFGELFLSMSFFVIVAGILLTVLIYSLNTESRSEETGVLSGLGFSKKQIIQIRFSENIITAIFGGIAGAFIGILYNYGIMIALNSVWQNIVRTNMLNVCIRPSTLFIGAIGGVIIALLAIYFVTIKKLKQPIIGLIRDSSLYSHKVTKIRNSINKFIAIISILIVIALVSYSFVTSIDQNASLILSAGGIFLISSIAIINLIFNKTRQNPDTSLLTLTQFAFKNAAKNKGRSIAIITLLALGTFTIIITGANRKTFYSSENIIQSGTGGFLFWSETTLPILYNLNSDDGKSKFGLDDEANLENVDFIQLHELDGDDASCLNLNQVQKPKILGVIPEELNIRNAFSFVKLMKGIDENKPWLELNKSYEKNVIPAFADQTVITWGLIKEIGDTLIYLNENGEQIYLVLIGGLNASIFQGNILIADDVFMKHFPSVSGSKTMLIDGPLENKDKIAGLLNTYFQDYGIELTSASERLSQFYSVTNTYLTVFMFLGGLGVIIGTLGLGIVLLRNIIERRHEIALLLAVGFSGKKVFKLIFIENIYLLLLGTGIGICAAIIGILPSLISPSYSIPVFFVFLLVVLVLSSGILWIYFPARKAINSRLITSLRNE